LDVHAILLTNIVMRDNGQAASALDLAIAARDRGVHMQIAVMFPPVFGSLRAAASLPPHFEREDVFMVPRGIRSVDHAQERLPPHRKAVRRAFAAVRSVRQRRAHARSANRFAEADLVVVATALSHAGLAALRDLTGARLLFNHAGSVDTFRTYWLTPEHVAPGVGDGIERYAAFVRQYDAVLFQAPDELEECLAVVPDLRGRVFAVRPSADEPALTAARAEASPFVAGRVALVNVGSLQPRKAQHVSIEAFASLARAFPAVDLHLVGAPFRRDYAAELAGLVASLDLGGRVFFHGHRHDYGRFVAHADVLLHSSRSEGVSRVFREAMFLARPIVATDLSGTRDTLDDGASALLVPPDHPAALAAALRRVLEDPALAASLGARAAERYRQRHAAGVYGDAVVATLRAVAGLPVAREAPARGGPE
jgi:glycosyltransferase involved in cell wall biosynthesis